MLVYLQTIEEQKNNLLFERLYTEYGSLMFSMARQIVKNKSDAEDAVHQTFLYIAGNMGKVRKIEEGKRKSFLLLVTEHKAVDIMRKNSRTIAIENLESYVGMSLTPPPDNSLAAALAELNVRYREAILLRYDYGYTTREIAKLYGISTESMQRLLSRAKKALAKKLEQMEDE